MCQQGGGYTTPAWSCLENSRQTSEKQDRLKSVSIIREGGREKVRWKFRNGRGKFQLWGEEKQGTSELGIKGWIEFVHKITLDERNLF